MRVATMFALPVPLAIAIAIAGGCGGVVIDSRDDRTGDGGGGSGGGGSGAGNQGGNPKDCPTATCLQDGQSCSCETTCAGPKLRAECKIHADGMIICECHYSGGYMGTCAPSEGPLCGLPDGCCEVYVP
jgi:hypothetical protein